MMSKALSPISLSGKVLLFCLYSVPVLALLWLVSQLSVNLPQGDQWSLVNLFKKVHDGTAGLDDFLLFHGEHRMPVSKAIYVGLAFASGWNIRAELGLSVFLSVITFFVLFQVSLRGFASKAFHQPAVFHLANLLTGCFVFSWIQHQNWLWGFQIPWFFISACLAIAISILYPSKYPLYSSSLLVGKRLGIAAVVCCLASFSCAHGLFTWIALVPSILVLGRTTQENIKHLSLWGLLFLACLAFYFLGYDKPSGATIYYVRSAKTYLGFFFVSLGFPLLGDGRHLLRLMSLGLVVFGAFASICFYVSMKFRTRLFWQSSPWLSLGLFACIFAAVNSYGRSGLGIVQALQSRYTTPSVLLCVTLLQLLPIVCDRLNVRLGKGRLLTFCAVVLVLQANVFTFALEEARYGEHGFISRLKQPACIEMVSYLEKRGFNACFSRNDNATRPRIAQLDRIGLRESFEDIPFVETADAIEELVLSSYTVNLNAMTSRVEIAGDVNLPKSTPLSQRPTAVTLALDGQKTFVAVTHLAPKPFFEPLGTQDRMTWHFDYRNEDFISLVAGARYFDVYLYYPHPRQFVLLTEDRLGQFSGWSENKLDLLELGDVSNEEGRGLEKRIGPNGQPVLLAHADTRIVVPLPLLDSDLGRQLSVSYGVLDAAWQEANQARETSSDGVVFRVAALFADGREDSLFSQWLDPHASKADRGEKRAVVEIPAGAQQIVLETLEGPDKNNGWDWSYWSAFEVATTPASVIP